MAGGPRLFPLANQTAADPAGFVVSIKDAHPSISSKGGDKADTTAHGNGSDARGGVSTAQRLAVAMDGTGMVVMGALHLVLVKFQTMTAANYATAVTLHSVIWVIPALLPYIGIQWWRGKLTHDKILVPDWTFVGISFSVAVASMLTYYSSQFTSGPLQVLLGQVTIPYSMIISWLYLGSRYRVDHFLGAVMVTLGIVVAIGHELKGPAITLFDAAWILGNLVSKLPFAICTVYLEYLYRERSELDPLYFFFLLSVFQLPFLLPMTLPCTYLSRPMVPLSDLPGSLRRGTLCLAGINSLPDDQCWPWAPIIFITNTIVTVLLIIPLFRLPKTGGSDLVWLCSALRVPLANLTFSLPFLPENEPLEWENCLALFIIITGILIYGFGQDRRGTSPLRTNLIMTRDALVHCLRRLKRRVATLGRRHRTPQEQEQKESTSAADAPPLGARQQCEDFL